MSRARRAGLYTSREGDWTSPFAYSILSLCHVVIELLRRPGSPALTRFLTSIGVIGAASAYLIHHDPWRFPLFFFATWWITYLVAPIANWMQHDACKFTDPFTSSNVNLSVLCRTLGFNVGYHSAHHLKPTLHWSRLASFHWARVAPRVPDQYDRPIARARFTSRSS